MNVSPGAWPRTAKTPTTTSPSDWTDCWGLTRSTSSWWRGWGGERITAGEGIAGVSPGTTTDGVGAALDLALGPEATWAGWAWRLWCDLVRDQDQDHGQHQWMWHGDWYLTVTRTSPLWPVGWTQMMGTYTTTNIIGLGWKCRFSKLKIFKDFKLF